MNSLIEEHLDRHQELLDLLGGLRILLSPGQLTIRPNARIAYQMLCSLSKLAQTHLSSENRNLYPALIAHSDAKLRSIAWGFIDAEKPIRQTFDSYHKKWLKDCSFNFTSDFIEDTLAMFDVLERRIRLEAYILFPKVEEVALRDGRLGSRVTERERLRAI